MSTPTNRYGPRHRCCDHAKRKAPHRAESAIDQAEKRHGSPAVGFVAVDLQHAEEKSHEQECGLRDDENDAIDDGAAQRGENDAGSPRQRPSSPR